MAPARHHRRVAIQWLVCMGSARDVRHGRLTCPLRSEEVDVSGCRSCHLLVTIAGEREPETDCVLPAGDPARLELN